MTGIISDFLGGNNAGQQAANQGNNMLYAGQGAALNQIDNSANAARGQYATNYYNPYTQSGNAANTMYSNALGLNGAQGNQAATQAYQQSPGYQFQLQQGTQAIDRNAAASGTYGSGNNAIALQTYGQGLANQDYSQWLNGLSGLNNQGLQAATGQTGREGALAGIDTGQGQATANIFTNTAQQAAGEQMQGQQADAVANAQSGSNLFSALLGGANLAQKAGLFSDEDAKTDVEPLGEDEDGTPMYAYRYKNDPKTYPKVVGPMAGDLAKKNPKAVKKIGGHKVVTGNWLAKMAA